MGARRRVFPEAFKREAVERVTSSGLPSALKSAVAFRVHCLDRHLGGRS